jgi:hypothetical protein
MAKNPDIKLGWSYPIRKKFLEDLSKQQGKNTYPIKFQSTSAKPFPIYSIEIDLPKYRLMNGRTQAGQEMYLAKHPKLSPDFFMDVESEEAQRVQHDLLWELVEKTKLLDYFKKTSTSQDEPLILTYQGLVVNGNRRLCAMRELYYGDRKNYSKFGHVDVTLLPVCTDRDIDELEAYLQIQPDIKEDYSWIAKACMLRARQEKYGYTNIELMGLYGIPKKSIENILSQLALVDDYLVSRGKAKQYDVFYKEGEYAFQQLLKGRQQLKQNDEKDFLTAVSFCLIDNADAAKGRLYDRIPDVKDNLSTIADHLAKELKPEPQPQKSDFNYTLLDSDTSGVSKYEPLSSCIGEPKNRPIVIDTVIDVIDSQKNQSKLYAKSNAVLHQVIESNTHLQNAINCVNEDTTKNGIEEQLHSIEKSIEEIRKWLSEDA